MSVSSDSSLADSRTSTTVAGSPAASRAGVPPPRIAPTDGELLTLFTRHQDNEALDHLIDRHAAMVWRVCRQSLRRQQDAEDAFQATFLMLVKSARSVRSSDSAAGWLYRVAYRNAIRARKKLASRREESLSLDPLAPSEAAFPDLLRKQTAGVLLEELGKLPERYQTPLVMRYLEGQSRRAIADQTDTTIAAVQGQLARGKQILRRRLLRRGVSLSVAMTAVAANSNAKASTTAVPANLVAQTASNSVALATGGSLGASAALVTLYREGVRAMFFGSLAKPVGIAASVAAIALLSIAPGASGEKLSMSTPALTADVSEVETSDASVFVQLSGAADRIDSQDPAAPISPEPSAAMPVPSGVLDKVLGTGTRVDLAVSPADLAEGEKGWIETQRRYYATRAAEDGIDDYEEPTFAELLKLHRYWIQKNHNAEKKRERLNGRGMQMKLDTPKAERAVLQAEMNQNIADWNLAQAKLVELERKLKRAAVAGQEPQKALATRVEPHATPSIQKLLEQKERLVTAQQNFVMYGDKNSEENLRRRAHIKRINQAINAVEKQITLTAAPEEYLTGILGDADVPQAGEPSSSQASQANEPVVSKEPPREWAEDPVFRLQAALEQANRANEVARELHERAFRIHRARTERLINPLRTDSKPAPTWAELERQTEFDPIVASLIEAATKEGDRAVEFAGKAERLLAAAMQQTGRPTKEMLKLGSMAEEVGSLPDNSPADTDRVRESLSSMWWDRVRQAFNTELSRSDFPFTDYERDILRIVSGGPKDAKTQQEKALRRFQGFAGIEPTGKLDEATWNALLHREANIPPAVPSPPVAPAPTDEAVAVLKEADNKLKEVEAELAKLVAVAKQAAQARELTPQPTNGRTTPGPILRALAKQGQQLNNEINQLSAQAGRQVEQWVAQQLQQQRLTPTDNPAESIRTIHEEIAALQNKIGVIHNAAMAAQMSVLQAEAAKRFGFDPATFEIDQLYENPLRVPMAGRIQSPGPPIPPKKPQPPVKPKPPEFGLPAESVYLNQLRATETYKQAPGDLPAMFENRLLERVRDNRSEAQSKKQPVRIIVGRVAVDEGDDPQMVTAQMKVLDRGYFLDVVTRPTEPVGFRMHGYLPGDVVIGSGANLVNDLGEVRMAKTPKDEQRTLAGKVKLPGGDEQKKASVTLRVAQGAINNYSNGYEPRSDYPDRIPVTVSATGEWEAVGLSPIKYHVYFEADGHLRQHRNVDLADSDSTTTLTTVALEKPRSVTIEYVSVPYEREQRGWGPSPSPPDKLIELARNAAKTVRLKAGDQFRSDAQRCKYGWDFEIVQNDGKLGFRSAYAPVSMVDLGSGELADRETLPDLPYSNRLSFPELIDGHVYLLDQQSCAHHVLFRVTVNDRAKSKARPEKQASTTIQAPTVTAMRGETAELRMDLPDGRRIVATAQPDKAGSKAKLDLKVEAPKTPDATPEQILTRLSDAYRTFPTYQDRGVVATRFFKDGGVRTTELPFETAYDRKAQRFGYGFTKGDDRYLIADDPDEGVRVWWDVRKKIEKPESLQSAIGGATGVSGGSASRVPGLLMPNKLGGWGGLGVKNVKRLADTEVDGVPCFQLSATSAGSPVELIIDQANYLLLQITESRQLEGFRTETVTTYEPKAGHSIADSALRFDPPEEFQAANQQRDSATANTANQYGPNSKMKQGRWRVFHKPSELNPSGWAVVAEVRRGEHLPILLPGDERPRPHVRLSGAEEGSFEFRVDDPRNGVQPWEKERWAPSQDEYGLYDVRDQSIQVFVLGTGAREGSYLVVLRQVTAGPDGKDKLLDSEPPADTATRLLGNGDGDTTRRIDHTVGGKKTAAKRAEKRVEPKAEPQAKLKQGQWRVFHKPSAMNPRGWAVIAELVDGEHAPIPLPEDERPRPHVRYRADLRGAMLVDPGDKYDGLITALGDREAAGGPPPIRGRTIHGYVLGEGDRKNSTIVVFRDETDLFSDETIGYLPPLKLAKDYLRTKPSAEDDYLATLVVIAEGLVSDPYGPKIKRSDATWLARKAAHSIRTRTGTAWLDPKLDHGAFWRSWRATGKSYGAQPSRDARYATALAAASPIKGSATPEGLETAKFRPPVSQSTRPPLSAGVRAAGSYTATTPLPLSGPPALTVREQALDLLSFVPGVKVQVFADGTPDAAASIVIPHAYAVAVFRQERRDEVELDDEALTTLMDQIENDVKMIVAPLLPKGLSQDHYRRVTVTFSRELELPTEATDRRSSELNARDVPVSK